MQTNILIKPSITEKSMTLAKTGQCTFFVLKSATKDAIKKVVETTFKVNVLKVRLLNKPGKTKRTGKKRLASKTKTLRKAIVTLESGQSIDYFKLPDDGASRTNKKAKKETQKSTPKPERQKKGFLGFGKRKEQRTQDK